VIYQESGGVIVARKSKLVCTNKFKSPNKELIKAELNCKIAKLISIAESKKL